MTIYFLGGGNMASAIISGLRKQQPQTNIHVVERDENKCQQLRQQYQVGATTTLPTLTAEDVLILAVKPQDMKTACQNIQTNQALVLSIAAGLSIQTLSHYLNGTQRIIRIMPNTPSHIGLGVAGMYAPAHISQTDKEIADGIMSASGQTIWLDKEEQMHSITGISGSGPAYVFYLLNALKTAAQEQGFSEQQAHQLSLATFKGAVALAEYSQESFAILQQNVTSKGGTTHEAIETFKQHQIAENIQKGVAACVARSQELSQQLT